MEVILRNDVVDKARPGDKVVFTGMLVVVPDVAAISAPGERIEARPGVPFALSHCHAPIKRYP